MMCWGCRTSEVAKGIETAYIGLGSNLGNGLQTLELAWRGIGNVQGVETIAISSPYFSEPVNMKSSNWFTNAVGKLETDLSAAALLDVLLEVERVFGRRRDENIPGYQDRTLDLDMLYFGDTVVSTSRLTLPHPYLAERLFVLKPLAELDPEYHDPVDCHNPLEKITRLEQRMASGAVSLQELKRGEWP